MASKNATHRYEERRDKVKADLILRQEADKEALSLVIKLVESTVTSQQLISMACHLTPDYYRDVTEERGLALHCGYPICVNKLKPASKYLQTQISSTPLWGRGDDKESIQLLETATASAVTHRQTDIPDQSVLIDTSTVRLDPEADHSDERIISEVLKKLDIDKTVHEDDDVTEGKRDVIADLFGEEELSDDSSSEDEQSSHIDDFLKQRRNQRLCVTDSTVNSSKATEEQWKGSLLTRTRHSDKTPVPSKAVILDKQESMTLAANTMNKKPLNDKLPSKAHRPITEVPKIPSTVPAGRTTKPKNPLRHDHAIREGAGRTRTVLLQETFPLAQSGTTAKHDKILQSCMSRLIDWFTDDSRSYLFCTRVKPLTDDQSTHSEVENSGPSWQQTSQDEVEVSPPNLESVSAQRGNIVYHHVLKSYGKVCHALPNTDQFRDKLGLLVKTFKLDRENISAKPLEWDVITLILSACTSHDDTTIQSLVIKELTKLTDSPGCEESIQTFVKSHKHYNTI